MKMILEKWKKINLIAKIWIICMLVIFILLIMVLWADSRDNGFIENELVAGENSTEIIKETYELNKAGFLETARGNTGGYRLAKKAKEYKIGEILRAAEGDLKPIDCLTEGEKCSRKKECKTYSFWNGLDNVITNYIDSKTLEDLIQ